MKVKIYLKKDFFPILIRHLEKFNLNKEDYLTMHSLQNVINVTIKSEDKGSAVVICDRHDYLKEAERQLNIYKEVKVT